MENVGRKKAATFCIYSTNKSVEKASTLSVLVDVPEKMNGCSIQTFPLSEIDLQRGAYAPLSFD